MQETVTGERMRVQDRIKNARYFNKPSRLTVVAALVVVILSFGILGQAPVSENWLYVVDGVWGSGVSGIID